MILTTLYDKKIFLWVLIGLPLIASTNIDCGGKSFHCFNSTHFMICVDLGGGVSTTIDDYFIPCPPPTVCSNNNQYECQFPQSVVSSTTVAYATAPSSVRVTNEFESTTPLDWEQIDVVTSLPFNTSVGHLEVQKDSNASVTESLFIEVTTESVMDNNQSENVTEIIPIPNTTIDQRVPATDRNVISDTNVKILNQTESVVDVSIDNATVVPEVILTTNVNEVNANETKVISEPVTATNVSNNNKTAEKETNVLNLPGTTNENVTTFVTDSVSAVDSPVENKKPTLIESDINSNITVSEIVPENVTKYETSDVSAINVTSLISETPTLTNIKDNDISNVELNSTVTPTPSITEDSVVRSINAGTNISDVLFENGTSILKVNDSTMSPETKDPLSINSSTVSTIAPENVITNGTSDVNAINETSVILESSIFNKTKNSTDTSTLSVTEDSTLGSPNARTSVTDLLFANKTSSLKVIDIISPTTLSPETKDPILINSSAVSTIAPEVVIMNETSGIAAINETSLISETSTLSKNKNNDTSNVEFNSTVTSKSSVTEESIVGSVNENTSDTDVLLKKKITTIKVNDVSAITTLSPDTHEPTLINSSVLPTTAPEIVMSNETKNVAAINETSLISETTILTDNKTNDTSNVEFNGTVTSTSSLAEDSIVASTNAGTNVIDKLHKNDETSTLTGYDISSYTTLSPGTKEPTLINSSAVSTIAPDIVILDESPNVTATSINEAFIHTDLPMVQVNQNNENTVISNIEYNTSMASESTSLNDYVVSTTVPQIMVNEKPVLNIELPNIDLANTKENNTTTESINVITIPAPSVTTDTKVNLESNKPTEKVTKTTIASFIDENTGISVVDSFSSVNNTNLKDKPNTTVANLPSAKEKDTLNANTLVEDIVKTTESSINTETPSDSISTETTLIINDNIATTVAPDLIHSTEDHNNNVSDTLKINNFTKSETIIVEATTSDIILRNETDNTNISQTSIYGNVKVNDRNEVINKNIKDNAVMTVENAGNKVNETYPVIPDLIVQNTNTILALENIKNTSEVIPVYNGNDSILIVNEISSNTSKTNATDLDINTSVVKEKTKPENSSTNETLITLEVTASVNVSSNLNETTTTDMPGDAPTKGPNDIVNTIVPRPTRERAILDIITTTDASRVTLETETKIDINNGTLAVIPITVENQTSVDNGGTRANETDSVNPGLIVQNANTILAPENQHNVSEVISVDTVNEAFPIVNEKSTNTNNTKKAYLAIQISASKVTENNKLEHSSANRTSNPADYTVSEVNKLSKETTTINVTSDVLSNGPMDIENVKAPRPTGESAKIDIITTNEANPLTNETETKILGNNGTPALISNTVENPTLVTGEILTTTEFITDINGSYVVTTPIASVIGEEPISTDSNSNGSLLMNVTDIAVLDTLPEIVLNTTLNTNSLIADDLNVAETTRTTQTQTGYATNRPKDSTTFVDDIFPTTSITEDTIATKIATEKYLTVAYNTKDFAIQDSTTTNAHIGNNVITPNTTNTSESKVDSLNAENNSKPLYNVTSPPDNEINNAPKLSGNRAETAILGENEVVSKVILPQTITGTRNTSKESTVIENKNVQDTDKIPISAPQILPNFNVSGIPNNQVEQIKITTVVPDVDIATISISEDTSNIVLHLPNKLENQDTVTMERNTSDVKQIQTSNETGINVISNVNKPVQDILTSNDFTDKTGLNMRDTTETISVLNEGLENYSGLNSEASSTDTEISNSALVPNVVIKTDNVASISVPNVHTDNKMETEILDSSITTTINASENVPTLIIDKTTTKEVVAVEPEIVGNTPPTTINTTYDSATKNELITSWYGHSLDKNESIQEDSNAGHSTYTAVTEANIVNTNLPVVVTLNTSYSEKASDQIQPDLAQSEDSTMTIVLTQEDNANFNIMETSSDAAVKTGLSAVTNKRSGLDLSETTSELKIASTESILATFVSDHTTKTTIDRIAAATPISEDAAMPINQNPVYSTGNGLLDTAVTEETYLPSHTNNKQTGNTEKSNTRPRKTSMQPVNSHVAGDSTKTLNEILDNFRKDVILRQPGAIDLPTTINTTNPNSITNSEATSSGTIEHTDTLASQTNIIMQNENETNIPSIDLKNSLTTLNGTTSVSSSTSTTIRTISIQPASSTESSNVIRPSDSFTVTNRSYSAVMENNLLITPFPLEESSPQNTGAVSDTTGIGPNTSADRETYSSSIKTYDNSEISTVQPSIPSEIFTTSTKKVDNMESLVSNDKTIIDGHKIIPLPGNNTNEINSTISATDERSESDRHGDVKNPLENLVINSQQMESDNLTVPSTFVPAATMPPSTTNVNSILPEIKPNETESEMLVSHTENKLQNDHSPLNKTMNNNGLRSDSLVNNTKNVGQAPQVIVVHINKIYENTNNKTNVIQGLESNSSDSTSNNDNIVTSGIGTNNTVLIHSGKIEANVTTISTTSKYTNKGKPITESDNIYEMLRNSQTVPISKTPVDNVLNGGNVAGEDSKLPQVPDFDKRTTKNLTALVKKCNVTQGKDTVEKDSKSMITDSNNTVPYLLTNNDTVLAHIPVTQSTRITDNIAKEVKNVTDSKSGSVKNYTSQVTAPAQGTVNNITHVNVGNENKNTNQNSNQNLHPVPGFVKNNVNNVTVSTLTTSIVSMVTSNSGVNVTETKFMNSSVTIYTSPGQSSLQTSTEHPVVTSPTITTTNTTKTTKSIDKTNEKVNSSVSYSTKLPVDKNLPKITTIKPFIPSATTTETAKKVNTEQTKATQYPLISSTTTERNNRKLNFDCRHRSRGRYSDNMDCRKFYICFGRRKPIQGMCPANTVFSEIKKQCTKNLSHCIRENQFKCVANGRFSDFFKQDVYYICVANSRNEFVRFKFQCQTGYKLNKETVRCVENVVTPNLSISIDSETITDKISAEDSEVNIRASDRDSNVSKSERKRKSDRERKSNRKRESEREREREKKSKDTSFECEEEGKFPDPNNCRKYYVCSKSNRSEQYRRRRKKCDSDEVFDKDKSRCVDAESS